MAYRNFKFIELEQQFNLRQAQKKLFDDSATIPVQPTEWLKTSIQIAKTLPLRNEKPKSEYLIAPILAEIKQHCVDKVQLFSGENLEGDKKTKLNGEVDYMIVQQPQAMELRAPIIVICEAKKGDIEGGFAQCAAQLYGARLFNQKSGNAITTIYGVVSSGVEWHFLLLENSTIYIDTTVYTISDLSLLLGTLTWIIDSY
jgi:hypothetical protein